ncbi:MAG: DNA polymerase III subunit gamma/tau [Alphaproteobacteria bacterium]
MTQAQLLNFPDKPENDSSDYRVLARKYRPQKFSDLYGQDVLVRVLTNGLQSGRLPHAFIFTGIRGVGKTTTARLLARALNCTGRDVKDSVDPCGTCEACVSIAQDRHIDVIEMDAASRTGVDDIREVIEAVKYKAVSAAVKVYIIDEVHMLSKSAFNALLKTLEEPPAHVKFIFATTEIRKVPKTVLSRCMRFDLARIDRDTLMKLFQSIAEQEGFQIEEKACQLIARAADGSARDGISILDQAVTMSEGTITTQLVSDMLGLADGAKVLALFDHLVQAQAGKVLTAVQELYQTGGEPLSILNDLMDLAHTVSSLRVAPELSEQLFIPESDIEACKAWAQSLSFPCLTRIWQVLMKGIQEVQMASDPLQACRMVLLRVVYMAALPTPEEAIQQEGGVAPVAVKAQPQVAPAQVEQAPAPTKPAPTEEPMPAEPEQAVAISKFEDIIELALSKREPLLAAYLQRDLHLVSFAPGKLELRAGPSAPPNLLATLAKNLQDWTGQRWEVVASQDTGAPSLAEQQQRSQQELLDKVTQHPVVGSALEAFPDAKIEDINPIKD